MKILSGAEREKRERQKAVAIVANRETLVSQRTVDWLVRNGWSCVTHPGHERGHDIEATRDSQHWIIEAKGCVADRGNDRNNFRQVLGEILMRRVEGAIKYSIAIPDLPHWRDCWKSLPAASKVRLGATCIFVPVTGDPVEVSE